MDKNTKLFYQRAKKLGLPVKFLPEIDFLKISLGRKNYYFFRSLTPLNEGTSIFISKNKFIANRLLFHAGFPVPKAVGWSKESCSKLPLKALIKTLSFPLVVKPMENSGRGARVLCNIKSFHVLAEQIKIILDYHNNLQIEEFHSGLKEYRVLVLKNRVIGVVERFGACVVGDGLHTIEQLIALSNQERARISDHLTISPLKYDLEYQQCLEEQGLSLTSIIPKGKKVRLCYTVNTGRGGDIRSLGKKIHPENVGYLCNALNVMGLVYGGFDILCEDINLPFSQTKWLIIEVNYNPDITIHEIPYQGIKVNVTQKILKQLILRHPFAYVYQLCFRSSWSLLIKAGLIILLLRLGSLYYPT